MEDNEIKDTSFQNTSLLNTSNSITGNTALQKASEYFQTHEYLSKQDLESFIKFISLDMVWTTNDDYDTFWTCLLKHKSAESPSNQITKNEALKGVNDLTTVSTSNSSSLLFNSIPFNKNDISSLCEINNTSQAYNTSYNELLNEFTYDKLLDIRNVLMLLRISTKTKTTVHYKDILNMINKYRSILNCNFTDVEKVIIALEDNHSITSSEYEVNHLKYELLLKEMNTLLQSHKMNKHSYQDNVVNLVLGILNHHLINYPDNIDVDNCVYVLNNYYYSCKENNVTNEQDVRKGMDTSIDIINTSSNNGSNKLSIIGKDGKQILLTNQHTVKPINDNIFTNESPLQPVSLHNSLHVTTDKEISKENTTIKIDDISNSRCDLFSLHENKENEKSLFDTTNIMDNSVRLPNNISEIEHDSSKLKPQIDFSTSFDKGKLSFLSISNINDKNKKENEIKEESNDDEHVYTNATITGYQNDDNNNKTHNINNIHNNIGNNSNNQVIQMHSNTNNNLTQRISINSNSNNNNISNIRSRNSRTINNTRVNDSRSTMSLSRLRNEDFSNILLSEAGQNTCYDFLSLKDNPSIMKMLENNNESENTFEFYSNTVYYFDQTEKKKYILLITSMNIFILDPITYAPTKRIHLKNLKKLTISNKNCNLLVFHFDDEVNNDLILEILRRIELLFYFRDLYKFKGYAKLQIKIANKFKIKKNAQFITMQVSSSSSKKFLITPNFENAMKIGYLNQYKQGLFKPTLKERLLVLTGVGLLIFDQPNEAPKALIPIIGNEIKKIDYKTYGMYGFQIKNSKGEILVFVTQNQVEFKSWYDGFKLLKNLYDNKLRHVEPVLNKKKGGWDY